MAGGLYGEVLLDHFRNPRNHGSLEAADVSYEDVSTVCGDEIRIDIRVREDRIAEIAFSGRGCAVSQAAASILTGMVAGRSLRDTETLTKADLLDAIGTPLGPGRARCALLSLHVLKTGLFGAGNEEE